MININAFDERIEALKEEIKNVKGSKTEVYTRIVGYFRNTNDWNNGKKEEYKDRITFKASAAPCELKGVEE